jgi:hypothetical protein
MTGYGKYEDMQAVKDFAEQNGMKQADAWDVIKRANYEVIVERGLMDRKDDNQYEQETVDRKEVICNAEDPDSCTGTSRSENI